MEHLEYHVPDRARIDEFRWSFSSPVVLDAFAGDDSLSPQRIVNLSRIVLYRACSDSFSSEHVIVNVRL